MFIGIGEAVPCIGCSARVAMVWGCLVPDPFNTEILGGGRLYKNRGSGLERSER